MTYEEIDERYHDAALDDDGEGWEEEPAGGAGWDDPVESDELDDDDAGVDEGTTES